MHSEIGLSGRQLGKLRCSIEGNLKVQNASKSLPAGSLRMHLNRLRFKKLGKNLKELGIWTALSSEFRKLMLGRSLTKSGEKRVSLTPEFEADIRDSAKPVSVNDLISHSQSIFGGWSVCKLRSKGVLQAELEAERRRLEPTPSGDKS